MFLISFARFICSRSAQAYQEIHSIAIVNLNVSALYVNCTLFLVSFLLFSFSFTLIYSFACFVFFFLLLPSCFKCLLFWLLFSLLLLCLLFFFHVSSICNFCVSNLRNDYNRSKDVKLFTRNALSYQRG